MASDFLGMSLTRAQALAAAGVLVLAYDTAVPAGETIAQGAAAAAAAAGGPKGAPKHVATAKGAQHFHAGIGGLIIPHGTHYAAGQPGHVIGHVSQASWIANQWKDKDKASEAAEKSVAAGTHHWVQAGEHSYAVHNGLETHIPKDTDVHDEAAVKNAPKVIVKHGDHPEHVMLSPDHAGEIQPHDKGAAHLLKTGYKKLPEQQPKKSVTFEGKHAAWVPHDWQVYKSSAAAESGDESHLAGKFAKDALGNWHFIGKNGDIDTGPKGEPEKWAASGSIVPDAEHHGPEPEHVAPNQGAKGAEPAKAVIGGVAVTKAEIHSAVQHLLDDKSTAVKQPLAKKGHPLAAMDYHAVAKAELAAHPELKVPAGTKKAHVGQVKLAVLHHLAAQAGKMAADEAHAKAAEEAAAKAEATAEHAQKLTPATFDIGGVTATKGEIQAAIADLQMSKSTAIKQILKAKENPLAGSDYWAVIKEYEAAHPSVSKHGTKQAHVANAKTKYIAALQEKAGIAAQVDQVSGHDVQAQLDQLITGPGAYIKGGWDTSADGSVAAALWQAAKYKQPAYAYLGPNPGLWTTGFLPPVNKASMKATPEHVVTLVLASGKEDHDFTPEHTLEIAKQWIGAEQAPAKIAAEPQPAGAAPDVGKPTDYEDYAAWKAAKDKAEQQAVAQATAEHAQALAEWKASPDYQVIDDLIENYPGGVPPHDNKLDTGQQLAALLYMAAKQHKTWYLYTGSGGEWQAFKSLPAGTAGTYGMPGKPWYAVDENHQITSYDTHSQPTEIPGEYAADLAKKWLVPKQPEPVAGGFDVSAGAHTLHVPAGSKVYVKQDHPDILPGSEKSDVKYIQEPDGTWKYVQQSDLQPSGAMNPAVKYTLDAEVKSGKLVPWPPEKPAAGQAIPVWVQGVKVGEVPAGSVIYTGVKAIDPATAVKYIKLPDGSWENYWSTPAKSGALPYHGTYLAGSKPAADYDEMLANGEFQVVSAVPPEPKPAAAEGQVSLISVGGHAFGAGSKVYQYKTSKWPKLVKTPAGAWHKVYEDGAPEKADPATFSTYDQMVKSGKIEPVPGQAPAPGPDILISVDGKQVGTVPAGSQIYIHKDFAGNPENANKFVKLPDGSWKTFWTDNGQPETTSYPAVKVDQMKAFVQDGTWIPYQPGSKAPEAGKTVTVKVGKQTYEAPPGSKVYIWNPSVMSGGSYSPEHVKYVEEPDGTWKSVFASTGVTSIPSTTAAAVKMGNLIPWTGGAEPEPAAPAGEPVTVEVGEVAYQAPAGSKVYVWAPPYAAAFAPDKMKYVEQPDGKWQSVSDIGVKTLPDQSGKVAAGQLVSWTPDTAPPSETQALKTLLVNGAIAPSTQMEEGKANSDWVLVTTLKKVAQIGGTKWASKNPAGGWSSANYAPYSDWESYKVSPDLQVTHHAPDGTETAVPPEKISELVHQMVTPDAVKLQGANGGPYKIYKHGFYYKPSKAAKAYLEIGPPPPGSSKAATYTYHAPSGTKDVNAQYAIKVLQDATEYYPQAKGAAPSTLKVAHATVLKPGSYQSWSDVTKAPAKNYVMEVFADGSMNVGTPGNLFPLPATNDKGESPVDALIKGGTILDQYGTSVVKPGVPTAAYHIFGSEVMGPEQVKDLLTQFEHVSSASVFTKLFNDTFSEDQTDRALEFFGDKAAADTWQGQRDATMGLLRELLQVPGQSAAAVAELVFLKSLPPGINSAKDVFAWTDQGYAKPADVTWPAHGLTYETSTDLTALIKQVSEQYGDGKVVGTHPSALAKDAKVDWLTAWQAGDMAKVFAYDSSGGKVSPAHPGAPKNADTHHITWAPWDPSQIPSSQTVEGNWTAPDVTMPQAEVHNYLIKAGLKHAEYLALTDRRAWVNAHRNHDQLTVDMLSKRAEEWFAGGYQPKTEPLTWTDNIQPAKPYDIFLEDKTAASNWTSAAATAFVTDHEAELLPFAQKLINDQGSSLSPQSWLETKGEYYKKQAIQAYLDDIKAKEYAESLKPVWVLTPGASAPQSSHPIYDLTATIPATGAKSRWYFKPSPASEKFLAEQEDAAARLAHLWGFKTPDSKLIEFNGQYGQAQHRLDALGDLSYGKPLGFYDQAPIPWNELTPGQVSDIAREHLLDWALDNDDGRASNFLRMPDGSITGIDKGRAWASFGHWKGLSGDSKADERSAQVVTQLYAAIRGHQISQETADAAYIAAIQRARRMQRLPDAQMRTVLEQAFASRSSFGAPGSKEALIQEAINRKNSLEKDFTDLWQRVYKDAGWQLPEVPEQKLPTLADGTVLHSGFTEPDFTDHVKASKSYGVPAFFGGTELDGGHFLVWHEYRGKDTGNEVIMGESAARGDALEKLTAWAKAHSAVGGGGYESQFGDVGGVKGEKDLYEKIIGAAKTVSHHAADKAFNQAKMDGLAEAKKTLEDRLGYAENQLAQGGHEAQWVKMYGDPQSNISMAKHYLDLIDRVEKAKDTGGTFTAGALPRWEPEKAPADDQPEIKVQAVSPQRHMTIGWQKGYTDTALNPDTGELHTNEAAYSGGEGGTVWQVTLPTGELIEIGDSDYTGVPLAQHGRIRFQAVAEDGAASLERIRAQLQAMGLTMNDATEQDLELFYWRHLAHILADRADSNTGKHAQVWEELKARATMAKLEWNSSDRRASIESLASLPAEEELAIWHAAWSKLTSEDQVAKWVSGGGHLPHLKHFDYRDPSRAGGKPDWYRFDITPEMMAKWKMPVHSFQSDSSEDAARLVFSGGLFSKEARMRTLGLKVSGMDNPASSGATGFVFTRLNSEAGSYSVYFTPKILARTTNYGWDEDKYGKLQYRKSNAYFDPQKAASWSSGGNETMVADALSLLDDVEILRAYNEDQRQMLIKELEQAGIDIIRGIPVSKRIVTQVGPALIAEIRAAYAEHPELLDPLEVAGIG